MKTNLRLHVLRKMEYGDTDIYIMQYDTMFQFIFFWDGSIYQDHMFLNPPFLKYAFARLTGKPIFNEKQIEDGEQIILSAAMSTLDKLRHDKEITTDEQEVADMDKQSD